MRKILIKGLLLSSTALLMASCIKEPFDLEECFYKLRVELDFIDTKPLDEKEQLKLVISSATNNKPSSRKDLTTDIHGRDLELLPDVYHFVVFEPADNVAVVDNVVSIDTEKDGTATQPGNFSGGASEARVFENVAIQLIHVPLHLQRRELIIEVKLSGDGVPYLKDLRGSVDGIAISRLINNGFQPIDKNLKPHAIKSGSILYDFTAKEKTNQTFRGSKFLLGLDGKIQQMLNLSANTSLGLVKDFHLDITQALDEFHTKDVHEPWYIKLELNLDSKLEMTIEDWKTGPESDLIAQ